ncbi:MAG TPA: hypothetical protein VHE54_16440 [Puia sp.]|nr:hypothetical protein [Puia sp.]
MNKLHLRPGIGLFVLMAACLAVPALSGCGPNEHGEGGKISYNEDSVRTHIIPIGLARQYTRNFRLAIDSFDRICGNFKDSMKFGHAESFPRDLFAALLDETNPKQGSAKGIRIYFGRGSDGEIRLVLVPYDSLGNDMIGHIVDLKGKPGAIHTEALITNSGQAGEDGQRCPTLCDDGASGLN